MVETTKTFDDLLEKFPDCAEGWALFGQILLDEKHFLKADQLFEKALEVSKSPRADEYTGYRCLDILKKIWTGTKRQL